MLDPDQIAEMEAAHAAATPGPWQTRFLYRSFRAARETAGLLVHTPPEQDWPDAEVACLAHNLLPALLADRRELLARAEAAERERDAILALAVKESYGGNPLPATSGFFSPLIRGHGPNLCRKFNSREEVVAAIRTAAGLSPKEAP